MGPKAPTRRNHLDEEEHPEEEEDLFSIFERERQHWGEVDLKQDQLEETKSWVMTSKIGQEVGRVENILKVCWW